MTEELSADRDGISRRALLTGLGATAGVAGLVAAMPTPAVAAAPVPSGFPEALGPIVPGLTYAQLDAYAFFNENTGAANQGRNIENLSGNTPVPSPSTLVAPLPIPCGSVIKQINVSYLGTPGVFVWRRPLANPRAEEALVNVTLPAHVASDPRAESVSVDVAVPDGVAATLRLTCPTGTSVFCATIGYMPPAGAFHPINPVRAFDSRVAAYPETGPLGPNSSKTVSVANGHDGAGAVTAPDAVPVGATAVAYNVTVTETSGPNFLAVTPGDAAGFTTSTINWSDAGLSLANGSIVAIDASRQVKIWGGDQSGSTQVIIDITGYFA